MIQGKIKNEPVEEEEDFDEKQSDASDLENHEDVVNTPLRIRFYGHALTAHLGQ